MTATGYPLAARSPLSAYGCAVLSIVLATGLRWLMDSVLGDHLPFITYFVAVMLTAWYAGLGPSLVAMGLGYLAATYFFVPHRGSFAATGLDNQIGIALYFFVGIVSALLSESQRRTQRRAEAGTQEALAKQRALEQEIAQRTRTEEALHESESRYRALAETLPQLVWTCQPDGRCDYLSRQWVEYTGVPAERHLGYGWTEQVHPDDRRHVQDVWAGAVRDGNLLDVEFRIRRADGQYRWFKTRAVPLRDPSGDIVKWFGSNTDIDELRRVEGEIRKLAEELESRVRERTAALSEANAALKAGIDDRLRLEKQQARLVAILESTTDFVAMAGPDGRVLYINRAGRKLIGLDEETDISGLRVADKDQPLWPADVSQQGLSTAKREGRWSGETAFPTRDGRTIPMSQVILAHKGPDGSVEFFSTIARDITERKQAEETLRRSEELLRKVLDILPVGVWIVDQTGRIVQGNSAAQQIWAGARYVGVEQYGEYKAWRADTGKRIKAEDWAAARAIRKGETSLNEELLIECFDGTKKTILNSALPIRDEEQRIVGAIIVNQDITEHKKAEEAVRLSEERYRNLFETSRDGLAFASLEGVIEEANAAYVDMLGYTCDEIRGMTYQQLTPARWASLDARIVEQVLARGYSDECEKEYVRKDGTVIPISLRVWLAQEEEGRPMRMLGVARDITERKRAEQQVRQAKERFQSLVETVADWIWEIDQKGRYTYVSPRIKDLLGYEPADLIGKTPFELMPPDEAARVASVFEAFLSVQAPFAGIQNTNLHKDGRRIVLETSGVPVFDGNGQFLGYRGVDRDITERKQAEEALVQSREMLRRIIDNIPQHVFWKDLNLNYLGCNALFARGAGVDGPDAIVGKNDFDLAWNKMAEQYRADDRSVMESKVPKLNFEEPQTRPDGSLLWLKTSKVPLIGRTGQVLGVLGIYEDITARKDMESRTSRLERLAAMGQLLSGIAHELKNPLFILTGYLQIGQEKLAQRQYETLSDEWKKIQEVAKRLEGITERFLRLALPVAGQQQRCSMPDILRNILDLARNELAQNRIAVRADYAPDLPDTWLDAGQVREVFLNLVTNAIQAMAEAHGQGMLTVSVQLLDLSPQPSASEEKPSVSAERWIEVRIQDDGPGIPPELRTKIFEPFFTTKPPGKGTGLGLWVVRSNLMILRGTVRVETETGKGTTFIVQLPVVAEPSLSADPQAPGAGRG